MWSAVLPVILSAMPIRPPKHILFLMIDGPHCCCCNSPLLFASGRADLHRQRPLTPPPSDLGFNDVSYRGTSDLASPNIDALANGGRRLERYYTHNLCSPSRTAFLSGRFASTLGMQGCVIINGQAVDLPRGVQTVADRLRGGGFATAAFGKWDAGMTTWDYTPTCRGLCVRRLTMRWPPWNGQSKA